MTALRTGSDRDRHRQAGKLAGASHLLSVTGCQECAHALFDNAANVGTEAGICLPGARPVVREVGANQAFGHCLPTGRPVVEGRAPAGGFQRSRSGQVAFTFNCTDGSNLVIGAGQWRPCRRHPEHNWSAALRRLEQHGVGDVSAA